MYFINSVIVLRLMKTGFGQTAQGECTGRILAFCRNLRFVGAKLITESRLKTWIFHCSRRCGPAWGVRELQCLSLRTVRGENTFLRKGSFPLELSFFQRLLFPLSRAALAVSLWRRNTTACAVRDSGNKSLWKEKGVWGERRTFPQKGVLSPQTARKGEHCNSRIPNADSHVRER